MFRRHPEGVEPREPVQRGSPQVNLVLGRTRNEAYSDTVSFGTVAKGHGAIERLLRG